MARKRINTENKKNERGIQKSKNYNNLRYLTKIRNYNVEDGDNTSREQYCAQLARKSILRTQLTSNNTSKTCGIGKKIFEDSDEELEKSNSNSENQSQTIASQLNNTPPIIEIDEKRNDKNTVNKDSVIEIVENSTSTALELSCPHNNNNTRAMIHDLDAYFIKSPTFSPRPSTSRDVVTINNNDNIFYKNLSSVNILSSVVMQCPDQTATNDIPSASLQNESTTNAQDNLDQTTGIIDVDNYSVGSDVEIIENHDPVIVIDDDDDVDLVSVENTPSTHIRDTIQTTPIEQQESNVLLDLDLNTILDFDEIFGENRSPLQTIEQHTAFLTTPITNIIPEVPLNNDYEPHNDKIDIFSEIHEQCGNAPMTGLKISLDRMSTESDLMQQTNKSNIANSLKNLLNGDFVIKVSYETVQNKIKKLCTHEFKNCSAINLNFKGCNNDQISTVALEDQNETQRITNSVEPPGHGIGDCPICMEPLASTVIVATICGHLFCKQCLEFAMKTSGKKCPTCRKNLKGRHSYHQIFI